MAISPGTHVAECGATPPPLQFTSLTGLLLAGTAAKGAFGVPTPVSTVAAYHSLFGGASSTTLLDHGVRQFFDNGGKRASVIRLAGQPGSAEFNSSLLAALASQGAPEALRDLGLIAVPGLADIATLQSLQAFARSEGKFLVIDSVQGSGTAEAAGYSSALQGSNSLNAACYYPWIMYGTVELPPGPAVAGVIARMDVNRGCWKAPAGTDAGVAGATGLSRRLTTTDIEMLNPKGICCLRQEGASSPVLVWGARTLFEDGAPDWKYISVRRLALALKVSLERGLSWSVFEPNDEILWSRLRLAVDGLLLDLFRKGAFQGQTPRDAYFLRCGLGQTMSEADVADGRVIVQIGFAALKPAEFVILQIKLRVQAR